MHRSSRRRILMSVVLIALAGLLALPVAAHAADFSITGRAWGHGIGMSQYGAQGYASQGWHYDRILAWYFQGTGLSTRSELTVKVDLDRDMAARSSWRISSGSNAVLTVADVTNPSVVVTAAPSASLWVTFTGGHAQVRGDSYNSTTKIHLPSATVIRTFAGAAIARTDTALALSSVTMQSNSGPYQGAGVIWRGHVRFAPGTSTTGHAINYVLLDQYVQGVVPRESPSSWDMEALKAQAVAARSYAFDAAASGSTLWCTTRSQMYNGADCTTPGHDVHETARTNEAVAATAHQVVVYGSTVVQTFFSSCAGGHTANVEDVWVTSAPKPYYKGVASADAEGGSPNATSWGAPLKYTGTSLGAALRAEDAHNGTYTWTAASPAAVTNVTVQRAASGSGYASYVTVSWSNGASYKIAGTTFQSALGLRSTLFSVALVAPPLLPTPAVTTGAVRFEQTASAVTMTGAWRSASATVHSGGSYAYTSAAGASLSVAFNGTGIVLVGPVYPSFGKAEVRVDGILKATVSQYGPVTGYQQHLYEVTGLPSGPHTITVRALGTKDAASTGYVTGIDGFDVFGVLVVPQPPSTTTRRVEQNGAGVTRSGTWFTSSSSVHSGGSYAWAKAAGAQMNLTFTGTGIKLIGPTYPTFGRIDVYIDGAYVGACSQYSSKALYRQVLYSKTGLSSASHRISVRWAGTKVAASHGTIVGVDAFDVISAP